MTYDYALTYYKILKLLKLLYKNMKNFNFRLTFN